VYIPLVQGEGTSLSGTNSRASIKNAAKSTSAHRSPLLIYHFLTLFAIREHRKPHGAIINNKLPARCGASGPRRPSVWADEGIQGRPEPQQSRFGASQLLSTKALCSALFPLIDTNLTLLQGIGAYRDDNGKPWVLSVVRKVGSFLIVNRFRKATPFSFPRRRREAPCPSFVLPHHSPIASYPALRLRSYFANCLGMPGRRDSAQ
jgi:hypothetical protein